MNNYTAILTTFSGVINTWNLSRPIFPADMELATPPPEFIKFSIITPDSDQPYGATKIIAGQIVFSIYTKYGTGDLTRMTIADELASLTEGKQLAPNLSTRKGYLVSQGRDTNRTLARSDYFIPYTYIGAI